jgi:hypothetical protein
VGFRCNNGGMALPPGRRIGKPVDRNALGFVIIFLLACSEHNLLSGITARRNGETSDDNAPSTRSCRVIATDDHDSDETDTKSETITATSWTPNIRLVTRKISISMISQMRGTWNIHYRHILFTYLYGYIYIQSR